MRARDGWFFALIASASLPMTAGCRYGGPPVLNLLGLGKPLVVALTTETPLATLNPFSPYEDFRKALGRDLSRPVALDLCLPLQLKPCLTGGFYHVAIVSPLQYAHLQSQSKVEVLAVTTDARLGAVRRGLLVVNAKSPIESVPQLRGKVIAFGPSHDSRTYHAGLALLRAHGLQPGDLSLELLPIPGQVKHLPDSRSVAQSVINGSSDAGFVDEADWERFAERAVGDNEPARSELRVLAKTVALPDRLVVSSPQLDPQTTEKIRRFLLAASEKHPGALRPLRCAGYAPPTEEILQACRQLAAPTTPIQDHPPLEPTTGNKSTRGH